MFHLIWYILVGLVGPIFMADNLIVTPTASVMAHDPPTATGAISNVMVSGNDLIVSLTNVSDQQVLTLIASGERASVRRPFQSDFSLETWMATV